MKLQLGLIISSFYDVEDYLDFIIPSHRVDWKKTRTHFWNSVIFTESYRKILFYVHNFFAFSY